MTFESTCGLVNRRGTCFWDGWLCICNKVWKVWERGQAYVLCWKSFRMWAHLRAAWNARIWSFLKMTMHFICIGRCCCSLLYSSFSSQRCGCIYALYLLFRFCARLLALSSSLPSQFLSFWRHNNETASAATVHIVLACASIFVLTEACLLHSAMSSAVWAPH